MKQAADVNSYAAVLVAEPVEVLEPELVAADDPERGFNQRFIRRLEDALRWHARSIVNIMNGGDPVIDGDDTVVRQVIAAARLASTTPNASDPLVCKVVNVRIEPELAAQMEDLAIAEDRNINAVIEEAIALYVRLKGPRQLARPEGDGLSY